MPCPPGCDHDHPVEREVRNEVDAVILRAVACAILGCHMTPVEKHGVSSVTGEVTISAVEVARKVREYFDSGQAHAAMWGRAQYVGVGMDGGNRRATSLIMRTLHEAGVFTNG